MMQLLDASLLIQQQPHTRIPWTMVYLFFDVFPVPIHVQRNRNVSKQQDVKSTA
jgi:hypothetical protein